MPHPLALVTGAARGIGAATAAVLARRGYHVILTDVAESEGRAQAERIRADGGHAEFHHMDVRDPARVEELIHTVEQIQGAPFDVIVNNAGYVSPRPLEQLDESTWHNVIDGNLTGMMRVVRAAAPAMRRARKGCIVCLSSIAGVTMGWSGRLAYSSAKAGITGFVRSLAVELGPWGIRVNGIAPAGLHAKAEQLPLGRVGTPEDIANIVALLASPEASFLTGQILVVDGGFTLTCGLPFTRPD